VRFSADAAVAIRLTFAMKNIAIYHDLRSMASDSCPAVGPQSTVTRMHSINPSCAKREKHRSARHLMTHTLTKEREREVNPQSVKYCIGIDSDMYSTCRDFEKLIYPKILS
jgi:hypothetical protein